MSQAALPEADPGPPIVAIDETGDGQSTESTNVGTSELSTTIAATLKSEKQDRLDLNNYLKFEETKSSLKSLLKSSFVQYQHPRTDHERVINILTVSLQKKVADCGGEGSKNCEVLNRWRSWSSINCLSTEVPIELEKAKASLKKETKKQSSITNFFKMTPKPPTTITTSLASDNVIVVDAENNNNNDDVDTKSPKLGVFGVSVTNEILLCSQLKIEKDLIASKETVELIKTFRLLESNLNRKSSWEHPNAKNTVKKYVVLQTLKKIEDSFKELIMLANQDNYLEEARNLPMEEMIVFLREKMEKAKVLAKELLLQINSKQLRDDLKEINTFLRKRISNIDKEHERRTERKIIIDCRNPGSSWEDCLLDLENNDWRPTNKNANVELVHFFKCMDTFRALELRGDEYITGDYLLDSIGFKSKDGPHMKVLNVLVEHLPLVLVRREDTYRSILMNVDTFLRSESMVESLMELVNSKKPSEEPINVVAGELPEVSRKEGSGRRRIIDEVPEILEKAQEYVATTGAGPAAEERRRDGGIGRVGFVMEDMQNFIRERVFKDHPEKCPSVTTLRRMMQAPSKSRNISSRYKADLDVRVGTKRNDAYSQEGSQHPHAHECATSVKLASEECCVISADNKCKIPVGGLPVVNRLNSLSRKFFESSSQPNYPDHDHRTGLLINPEGYMILDGSCNRDDDNNITRSCTNSRSNSEIIQAREGDTNENPVQDPGRDQSEYLRQDQAGLVVPPHVDMASPELDFENQTLSMPMVIDNEEVGDEIDLVPQLDGGNDSSSDDEFEFDITKPSSSWKRQRLESDSDKETSDTSSEPDVYGDDDAQPIATDQIVDQTDEALPVDIPEDKIILEDGKPHVAYPCNGPSYIFNKSHRKKPSHIWTHMNDLLTMEKVEPCMKKPVLLLLLDDGADWGGKMLTTQYFLGKYFFQSDKDMMLIRRPAPNMSRFNPIERLWSYVNNVLVGLMLPHREPDENDDDLEDRSIQRLNSAMEGAKYNGHPITCVAVPCNDSKVEIGGEVYENDFYTEAEDRIVHDIMDKKRTRHEVRKTHPEIAETLKLIYKHCQSTLHGYVFRKCLPQDGYVCQYCKDHPWKSSKQLMDAIPSKKSGAMFYDCIPDPQRPGHYMTFIDLLKSVKTLKITPDGMFPDAVRCQESHCFTTFKSNADAIRHHRLAHDKPQPTHPDGHVCRFKVNGGVACGQAFDSYHKLQKHKTATGHKVPRMSKKK